GRALEHQRRPAGPHGARDDLADLQVRIDRRGDLVQVTGLLEGGEELAEVCMWKAASHADILATGYDTSVGGLPGNLSAVTLSGYSGCLPARTTRPTSPLAGVAELGAWISSVG